MCEHLIKVDYFALILNVYHHKVPALLFRTVMTFASCLLGRFIIYFLQLAFAFRLV